MKRISTFTIATAFALILALGFAGTAQAALVGESVTLNGGAVWTIGGADGASVTVAPGANITVVFTVSGTTPQDWECTSWDIGGLTSGIDDFEPNHFSNFGSVSETFVITAPAVEDTYDLVLNARANDNGENCVGGQSGPHTLVDAVIVEEPPGIFSKELISGPNDNAGAPIAVTVNANDAGGVLVNHPDSQHFEFKITVTNNDADDTLNGLKILDVVGAEFDPDPGAEDAAIPETGCTIAEGGDGVCDGIMVGGTGTCTALITPRDPERQLDPHFIHIVLGVLDEDETCEVTVWVKTDENPASVRDTGEGDSSDPAEKFEPTGCHLVMAPDLFDTFTLNEGIKVFDPNVGIRILGPVGSLQLTCNFPA